MIDHIKRLKILGAPDLGASIESSPESLKRGTVIASKKDTPQPTRALQEFVQAYC